MPKARVKVEVKAVVEKHIFIRQGQEGRRLLNLEQATDLGIQRESKKPIFRRIVKDK